MGLGCWTAKGKFLESCTGRPWGSVGFQQLSQEVASCWYEMVGERGFEPPTPWSRTRCSTRLSHSPNVVERSRHTQRPGSAFDCCTSYPPECTKFRVTSYDLKAIQRSRLFFHPHSLRRYGH